MKIYRCTKNYYDDYYGPVCYRLGQICIFSDEEVKGMFRFNEHFEMCPGLVFYDEVSEYPPEESK